MAVFGLVVMEVRSMHGSDSAVEDGNHGTAAMAVESWRVN